MKKIMVLPLDERPCNYYFNQWLVAGTPYEVITPPLYLLGKKKTTGDVDQLFAWVKEHYASVDGAVLALDTLLYSGIIPSRLHNQTAEALIARMDQLVELKSLYPDKPLYAYNLIMRNPAYSSSEEEPDYYAIHGRDIHLYGVYQHKIEIGIASSEEQAQYDLILNRLPQEILDDYLGRRSINLSVNQHFLSLVKNKVIDFGIVPQDDSSPYGLTAKDQNIIRKTIDELEVNTLAYMYPGADEVTNTLLARMINVMEHKRPLIYVKYTSSVGPQLIPPYEDRLLSESVKYHVLAAGGLLVDSVKDSDIVMILNTPGGPMIEASNYDKRGIAYTAFRNLIEAVEFAEYAIKFLKKPVVFSDVAYANGGDLDLIRLLKQKGLLYLLAGYAGWNTSSNTIGTALPQGMFYALFGKRQGHLDFLALRYTEDVGYCAIVRKATTENYLCKTAYTYFELDGERGEIASYNRSALEEVNQQWFNTEGYEIEILDSYQPWNRMFEIGLLVRLNKA